MNTNKYSHGEGNMPLRIIIISSLTSFLILYGLKGGRFGEAKSESTYDPLADLGLFLVSGKEDTGSANGLFYKVYKESYEENIDKIDAFHFKEGGEHRAIVADPRRPYSDYWFPEKYGGTNGPAIEGRPQLQTKALEMYDKAFYGGESKATAWEILNHNDKDTDWFGHCNGQSAAAARHQNPGGASFKNVFRPKGCDEETNCVKFTPMMLRALMAEIYMTSKARFIGGHRCEVEEGQLRTDYENRPDPESMTECQDPNPGTFHLALTNWLGRKGQVIIGDFNRDVQVWNFPIYGYKYSYRNGGQRLSRAEALAATGSTKHSDYVFNKEASSFVVVDMAIYYAKALDLPVPDPKNELPARSTIRRLAYILELDESGKILGGEWIEGAKKSHPDFIWIPFEPGKPSGNRTLGNPHIDAKEVLSMWGESQGFTGEYPSQDTKNPNTILLAPSNDISFGEHSPWYQLSLNGQKSGAVFLGRDMILKIEPDRALSAPVDFSVVLNGTQVDEREFTGEAMEIALSPGIGMNQLELIWKKDGTLLEGPHHTFRFFAMR